jgi:hypothetical protein
MSLTRFRVRNKHGDDAIDLGCMITSGAFRKSMISYVRHPTR